MRKFIRTIIAQILILFGFVRRESKRVQSESLITSIYFHNPSKELFEKCIKWLIDKNYHFISTDDLYDILYSKKPMKKGAVCLTVDDGFKDNLANIIPVISEHNIPLTIFIATEPVNNGVFWWSYINRHNEINKEIIPIENYKKIPNIIRKNKVDEIKRTIELPREAMSKDDVIKISKLENVTIGNHTVNHPITKSCKINELEYEITEASNELTSWISNEITFFAYPNGDFDGREISILKSNKIKLAFTTSPKYININETINQFQIPRFSVNDNGSFAENVCKMVGVWQKYLK